VADGETGLLVEPGDDAALAVHLGSLLTDRNRAAALGAAGRQRALVKFSISRMAERTLALYEEVLS
jgi:glycosyltransferase involved in cell wall biosynthesis